MFHLHAKDRSHQWYRWIAGAVLAGALYAIAFSCFFEGNWLKLYGKHQLYVLLPTAALYFVYAYMVRWNGRKPEDEWDEEWRIWKKKDKADAKAENASEPAETEAAATAKEPVVAPTEPEKKEVPGEDIWLQARDIKHKFIPDALSDSKYLKLLHQAADLGNPDALMKLSEYAMRRHMLVEAYFWTSLAKRNGCKLASPRMVELRKAWKFAGCPNERDNAYEGFGHRRGSIGRALLKIDCRIDAPAARARIKELAQEGNPDAAKFIGS